MPNRTKTEIKANLLDAIEKWIEDGKPHGLKIPFGLLDGYEKLLSMHYQNTSCANCLHCSISPEKDPCFNCFDYDCFRDLKSVTKFSHN